MKVVILDTGCANLFSLAAAVKRLGVEPIVTCDAATIRSADRIFLPGVGTARAAMASIRERGLTELIRTASRERQRRSPRSGTLGTFTGFGEGTENREASSSPHGLEPG